jgi:hypothetical protein
MLTAEELCDICGVTPNQRQDWAAAGDLRRRRGFEERDVVELAALARLREAAGPKRARAAWSHLRGALLEALLTSPRDLWVVIEAQGVKRHSMTTSSRELARTVEHGRPVHVVEIRRSVDAARRAFREAAPTEHRSTVGTVRTLRPPG